ncbi:MAG: energy transducer TonB, partial [Burkholderiales bacterium]
LSPVPLLIPEYAYHSRLMGRVRARVFIGADGSVDKVAILDAAPVRGLFEEPAVAALRKMRYRPARIEGRPVRSQKVVEVVFDPRAEEPAAGK